MFCNNADVRRCSYFEPGLPVLCLEVCFAVCWQFPVPAGWHPMKSYEAKWKRWESVWYAILSDHALEANGDRLVIEFLRILEESATSWLDIRECYWSTLGWSRKKEASARDSWITKLRRQRQRERQNSNRFNKQNNNSARASRFIVYFFAVPAELQREMTKF